MKLINILICLIPFMLTGISWSTCESYTMGGNWAYSTCKGVAETQCTGWIPGSSGGFERRCCEGRQNNGKCFDFYAEGSYWCYIHYKYCDTQCEQDSLKCINSGNDWTTIPSSTCNGKGCKESSCISSDTLWLKTSISTCQDIQGSNNYAIVDTNDVCEHRGHCCSLDSIIDGKGCKWRCESQDSICTLSKGKFEYSVVADTAIDGSDTTYTGLCYNNCFTHPSKDSLTGLVTGNVTAVNNTSMEVGTYYPDGFKGIRSDYAGLYVYDFLSDENYEWADSLLSAPCSVGMYRGVKNGKYVYWKSGQPVPAGVTNVVKIK